MTGLKQCLTALLVLVCLVIGPFITFEMVYLITIRSIRDKPLAPQAKSPPRLISAGIWSSFGESMPVEIKPISSFDVILSFLHGQPFIGERGTRLTSYLAQTYLRNESATDRMLVWHLKTASLSIWLSRNWSTDQVITSVADLLFVSPGIQGVKVASQKLFGKTPDDLSIGEIASLLAITKTGNIKAVNKTQEFIEHRNSIIESMFQRNLINKSERDAAIQEPLTIKRLRT